ncbi:hypothetical protein A6456_34615 [Paraburkholderia tropica]|nr:hypothetical protein A6456_34615 [Paraburkholderia tropica]
MREHFAQEEIGYSRELFCVACNAMQGCRKESIWMSESVGNGEFRRRAGNQKSSTKQDCLQEG